MYCSVTVTPANQGSQENKLKLVLQILVNNFKFPFFPPRVTQFEESRGLGVGYVLQTNNLLLKCSLLSNDIVLPLYSDRGLSNNTDTKNESMSDVMSDWSSAGIVPAGVTTDYMRPKRSCDFSHTVSTFSPNLQSPYWHFWHHLLEILNSSQLSSLHKNSGPRHSTGHISVLNKRHWCQNRAAVGKGYVVPRRALVVQTIVGEQ